MIKQLVFTVAGNTDVDDDVIYCNRLVFTGPHPQLVIRPKKNARADAQRLLKIITNTIDTQLASDPEITYNLADDFTYTDPGLGIPELEVPVLEFPVGDSGLDPETQATPGKKGISDFEFPIPKPADPDFNIFDPEHVFGAWPKAKDGGDGKPGARGNKGVNGMNAPILEIWTKEIVGTPLTLDLRGQRGGNGGKGGNGQNGGNGQVGSIEAQKFEADFWSGGEQVCTQRPGMGGEGGRGGDAGCGGDGGNGGNGGVVKVFHTSGVDLTKLTPEIGKGKGGNAGPAGNPGIGGKGGPPGFRAPVSPCLGAADSSDGPNGNLCPKGEAHQGGIAQDGEDGVDGYYVHTPVANIPEISLI